MAGARGPARRQLVARLLGARNRRRDRAVDRGLARAGAALRRAAWPAVALAVGILVWPTVRDGVRRHPYFAVQEVAVRKHGRLTAEAIRTASGIEPGMSIWDVDGAAAARRLERLPWIRAAQVRRELPHRVTIQVREYRPAAILALGDRLYYVASSGRIFSPVGREDAHDLAYVTGLSEDDVRGRGAYGGRALRRALALLRAVARSDARAALGPISELHVDRQRGLVLLPVRPTVPIEVGWDGWAARLARLPPVLAQWSGRETELAGVSLLFGDVVVRARPPARPARVTGRRTNKI